MLTILLKTTKPLYYRYVLGTLHGTLKKGKIPLARGPPSPPTPDGIAASLPSWLRASVPYDRLSEPHIHAHTNIGAGVANKATPHTQFKHSVQSVRVAGSKNVATGEKGDRAEKLGHLLCFLKHDMTSHDKKTGLAPRVKEELARWPGGEILNWDENK